MHSPGSGNGLGERGEPWWELSAGARLARARDALRQLDGLDASA